MLRIGIDLDNTIVDYEAVFAQRARLLDVPLPLAGGKTAIRDKLRALPEGDIAWQRLQADVYGRGIEQAKPFAGFDAFLAECAQRAIPVWVVSHKTVFAAADPGGINLRQAALRWIERQGFLAPGGAVRDVFFESTRSEKIDRIRALQCTDFVDDLAEVFAEPAFPTDVRRFLFGARTGGSSPGCIAVADWAAAARAVLRA